MNSQVRTANSKLISLDLVETIFNDMHQNANLLLDLPIYVRIQALSSFCLRLKINNARYFLFMFYEDIEHYFKKKNRIILLDFFRERCMN